MRLIKSYYIGIILVFIWIKLGKVPDLMKPYNIVSNYHLTSLISFKLHELITNAVNGHLNSLNSENTLLWYFGNSQSHWREVIHSWLKYRYVHLNVTLRIYRFMMKWHMWIKFICHSHDLIVVRYWSIAYPKSYL